MGILARSSKLSSRGLRARNEGLPHTTEFQTTFNAKASCPKHNRGLVLPFTLRHGEFRSASLAQSGSRVLSKVKKALWSFANARSNEIEILPKLDKDFYNHPFSFLSTPTDFMFVVHVPAVETTTFLKWYLTTPIPIKKRNASEYYLTRHPDFVFKNEHVSWVGALGVGQYCKTGFSVTSVTRCWNKK